MKEYEIALACGRAAQARFAGCWCGVRRSSGVALVWFWSPSRSGCRSFSLRVARRLGWLCRASAPVRSGRGFWCCCVASVK